MILIMGKLNINNAANLIVLVTLSVMYANMVIYIINLCHSVVTIDIQQATR